MPRVTCQKGKDVTPDGLANIATFLELFVFAPPRPCDSSSRVSESSTSPLLAD